MKYWEVKKGNTSVQDIPVYDRDGNLVTNLADATAIKFQVKETKKSASFKFEKTKGDGIAVDTPTEGWLRITTTPTDNDIDVKDYVMGLELTWSATENYETILKIDLEETYKYRIEQDIVL